jgi:hypothetical protein
MIRSFHRIGGDLEVDAAFETLRGPLDELKEMKIEEWGTSKDEIEASDSKALTQAQSQAEDVAALDAIEEDDPQAPKAADGAALQGITEDEHPQPQAAPKVWRQYQSLLAIPDHSTQGRMSEGAVALIKHVLPTSKH